MDSRPTDRTAAAASIYPRFFISSTVPFGTCNNMEQARGLFGIYFPFFQQGHSQKVPVQHKQGAPEMPGSAETIAEHLYYVGDRFIPKPFTDDTIPILDLDRQGNTKRF